MPNRRTPPRGGRPPRNNRPAQRGGAARPRSGAGPVAPRPRFTNRAVILLVVFALLVVSYASSMRAYLNQRSQIDQLLSQIDNYDTHIRSVKAEIGRWNDPNYVVQQARSRFGWVLPGEIAYQVLDSNGEPMTGKDKLADPSTVAHPTRTPEAWWTKIADSAQAADQPKILVRKPPPVTKITSKGANNQ